MSQDEVIRLGGWVSVKTVCCCNLLRSIEANNIDETPMRCSRMCLRLESKAELVHCRAKRNSSALLRH